MSSGSPRLGIFIATMTGYAEICAEEIETALSAAGLDCERLLMDGLDAAAFDPFDLLVIVSSTYGQGDIPDNGQALFESIEADGNLAGKRFAVFGLGDMTYSGTFCAAGTLWDRLLTEKGGKRLVEPFLHDASSGTLAEDEAGAWAAGWAASAL